MKRKIFIFGGQGFIGTNLAIFFSRSNDVYVIGNKDKQKSIEVFLLDNIFVDIGSCHFDYL